MTLRERRADDQDRPASSGSGSPPSTAAPRRRRSPGRTCRSPSGRPGARSPARPGTPRPPAESPGLSPAALPRSPAPERLARPATSTDARTGFPITRSTSHAASTAHCVLPCLVTTTPGACHSSMRPVNVYGRAPRAWSEGCRTARGGGGAEIGNGITFDTLTLGHPFGHAGASSVHLSAGRPWRSVRSTI